MKLSIIIPVYNKEDYLSRCFDSILNQIDSVGDKDKYEILVVDDGSIDNSVTVIDDYSARYSLFSVIKQSNAGVSVARNVALEVATGDFVLFLDADDELIEGALLRACEFLAENENIDMLVTVQTRNNGQREIVATVRGLVEGKVYTGVEAYQSGYVRLNAGGAICRTEFLREHNILFPVGVRNSEDTIFFGIVQSYSQAIAYLNLPLYRIHELEGSASRTDNTKIALNYIDTIKAATEARDALTCSRQQKGIFEFYLFQLLSNMIVYFVYSKSLNFSMFNGSVEIQKLLPVDTCYMCIRRNNAHLLNFSYRLYYFLSWLKHRLL